MMLQGLDPKDCADGQGGSEKHHSQRGKETHLFGAKRGAGLVLLKGPETKAIREEYPDQQGKYR